jgi:flagellar hook-length control protein FliK
MTNVTSAGPTRGIFDVLFGAEKQEAESAEGFGPLMDMIKALKEKVPGEQPDSRTEKETIPGKGEIDYRAVGMLGNMLNIAGTPVATQALPEGKEGEAKPSVEGAKKEGGIAALLAGKTESKGLSGVDPELVSKMLEEKSAAPLTAEELKLLSQVNEKLAAAEKAEAAPSKAMESLLADIQGAKVMDAEGSAATTEMKLAQPQGQKVADPKVDRKAKVEITEVNAKPAEKFVSTESYLQMHEQKQVGAGEKEGKADKADEQKTLKLGSQQGQQAEKTAVAGKGAKGQDLLGGNAKGKEISLERRQEEKKLDAAAPSFTHDLLQSIRNEASTKEVFLTGTSAKSLRAELSGEVNQNVNLAALKGGGEMKLIIRPDGMGEVKLRVEAKEGKIGVHITAENEEVARAIKDGSKDLEKSLRDQNLSLSKFEVALAADAPVAETSSKQNFNDKHFAQDNGSSRFEQFSQNFSQGRNEQRFGGWENQNQRNPFRGMSAEATGSNGARANAANRSFTNSSPRNGSGRLDVSA